LTLATSCVPQEAIQRIKERERRKGIDQAKAEVTALRSFE
jgi:hypothetical protein